SALGLARLGGFPPRRGSASGSNAFLESGRNVHVRPLVLGTRRAACDKGQGGNDDGPHHVGLPVFGVTRTGSPATIASFGLTMTRSLPVRPEAISIRLPKSRPSVTESSCTRPVLSTTATCTPCGRNSNALTCTETRGWLSGTARSIRP